MFHPETKIIKQLEDKMIKLTTKIEKDIVITDYNIIY